MNCSNANFCGSQWLWLTVCEWDEMSNTKNTIYTCNGRWTNTSRFSRKRRKETETMLVWKLFCVKKKKNLMCNFHGKVEFHRKVNSWNSIYGHIYSHDHTAAQNNSFHWHSFALAQNTLDENWNFSKHNFFPFFHQISREF